MMIEKKMLFSPGPVMTSDNIKQAALAHDICHRRPVFEELYSEIRSNLLSLFKGTKSEYTSVVISGSGTSSNETVLSSVVGAQEKVLLIANGEFGFRLEEILNSYGVELKMVDFGWGGVPGSQ